MVARLKSMAVAASSSESFISTTSAESMAMSVPAPMAMPMSARISAGASFTPSPTMATLCPCSCRRRMTASFSVGSTSAMASPMSSCLRMASAVLRLSPVSMTTFSPISRKRRMAARLVSRTVSATAMTPRRTPLRENSSGVLPSFARRSMCACAGAVSSPLSVRKAALPARYSRPPSTARTPRPEVAENSSALGMDSPSARAFSTTASANGCSLPVSTAAASARKALSVRPFSSTTTSVTEGWPEVMVPVLSNTMVSTLCRFSSASALLMSMPNSAALPVPTMMATGVARPSAQGQEMTSTEMALESANSNPYPAAIQTMAVTTAMAMTTGTNTPLTLSARRAMGALEEPASSTRRMICASVVSLPTREARKRKEPFLLMVAEITESPARFSTGMLSPVMAAWSTKPKPSMTSPSTGMLSPGRMTTMSPATTCSAGTVTSSPPRTTTAVLGARSISLPSASEVLDLERASRNLPTVTSVRIIAADSK